ncbi:hypothetical protein MKX03_009071 [Papaver bracteatum]|nr:hypothetical protein MKX03_009071 [Papaver bracteatum]
MLLILNTVNLARLLSFMSILMTMHQMISTPFLHLPPPEKPYFAAGVPGSFHSRLFPKGTLHIAHSSTSLHWLSRVPNEVLDVNSPAYNKGRIHYTNAKQEVFEAYSAQYAKDIEAFLHARAEEVISGGLVVLTVLDVTTIPDETPPSRVPTVSAYDILGSCFMEMAKEGIVEEAKVDSFNLPVYSTTPKELKKLVRRNGYFNIERIADILPQANQMRPPAQILSEHVRAATEGVIISHFGFNEHIIDHLFQHLCPQKIEDTFESLTTSMEKTTMLFVLLKRK